jgi:hypothetical protein
MLLTMTYDDRESTALFTVSIDSARLRRFKGATDRGERSRIIDGMIKRYLGEGDLKEQTQEKPMAAVIQQQKYDSKEQQAFKPLEETKPLTKIQKNKLNKKTADIRVVEEQFNKFYWRKS